MTVNGELVLNWLKQHYGAEASKQDIAKELGISIPAVTGTINSLVKNGLAVTTREEIIELEPATETRKAKTQKILYHTLTEAGLAYDPVEAEAEKAAKKAAEKEARKAEREAKKAAAKTQKDFDNEF